MKKTTIRIIAGIVAVAAIGGGAVWWQATVRTKQSVVDTIARINATPAADGSKIEITYDRIETAGFPPGITVRLVNPKAVVTVPDTAPAQAGKAAVMEWAFQGNADIVTNHIAAAYKLHLQGNDTIRLDMADGAQPVTIEGSGSDYSFAVKARSFRDFLAWEKLDIHDKEQVGHFVETIRKASADFGALRYVDAASKAPAFTQDKSHVGFVNRTTPEAYDFDLEIDARNSQVYEAYAGIFGQITGFGTQDPALGALGMEMEALPFSAARAGKQNMDVAISGYIKRDPASRSLRFTAPRLSIANNFYAITAPFEMHIEENAEGMKLKMKMDDRITVTAAGAADMQRTLDMFFAMAQSAGKDDPNFDAAAFKAKVTSALPTVSTLGPITFAVDIAGTVAQPAPGTVGAPRARLEIGNFDFSHARWGLKAEGNVDTMEGSPAITMKLVCEKCDAMTSDAMKTAVDAQEAARMIDPARPPLPLGEPLLQAIDRLLAQVGKKEGADIVFAITTPAPNDIRIGEQPMGAVLMQAMTALMPFMQPQAAQTPIAP